MRRIQICFVHHDGMHSASSIALGRLISGQISLLISAADLLSWSCDYYTSDHHLPVIAQKLCGSGLWPR